MRMRDVPNDEADEVRSLLLANDIEFFETYSGNWGISMPALWVKSSDQFAQAQQILNDYQQSRLEKVQSDYNARVESGEVKTWRAQLLERPFQFVAYWILIAIVLFISIYYFFTM